jgi:hypothetical protein
MIMAGEASCHYGRSAEKRRLDGFGFQVKLLNKSMA